MKKMFVIGIVMMALTACGPIVRPQDAALFDTEAANARAYSASVQGDATVPAGVKAWIKADAGQWTSASDWANGRKPAATQP